MTAFGHLPRTRILDGAPEGWLGRNGLFSGIELFRGPNAAGIWAQEYWEWRLHALWALAAAAAIVLGTAATYAVQGWAPLALGLLAAAGATAVGLGHRSSREIFSHAITLEAASMLGLPCTVGEMVASLQTYPYCAGLTTTELALRLDAGRPQARAWCIRHGAVLHAAAAVLQP
jgi:hypothetical protein